MRAGSRETFLDYIQRAVHFLPADRQRRSQCENISHAHFEAQAFFQRLIHERHAFFRGLAPDVRVDPALLRPAEVDHLLGDPTKAGVELGWAPSIDFKHLVEMMVDSDLKLLDR